MVALVLPAIAAAGLAAATYAIMKPPPPLEPEERFEYTLWGKTVKLGIPKDRFPTDKEMEELEATMPGCEHGWFASSQDKEWLHYRKFLPKNKKPKAIVVFHHGIQSHSGLSWITKGGEKLSTALMMEHYVTKHGYALYAMDQLGHGYSEGRRMFIPDYKTCVADLVSFARLAATDHNDAVPLFVSGHSFGGCLALHAAHTLEQDNNAPLKSFKGFSVIAPAIDGDMPPPPVYQLLRYVLAPKYPTWTPFFMPNPVTSDRIWRDAEALALNTSPRHMEMGLDAAGVPFLLGTALQMVVAMETVRNDIIPTLEKVPFCAVHGTSDYGVPVSGTDYLEKQSKSPVKQVHRVDGAYHDLFADPAKEEVMGHLCDFIQGQI